MSYNNHQHYRQNRRYDGPGFDANPAGKRPRFDNNRVSGANFTNNHRQNYNSNINHYHPQPQPHHLTGTAAEYQHSYNTYYKGHTTNDYPHGDLKQLDKSKLLSFKSFLSDLPDEINEVEAANRYNEYKIQFKKEQAKNFFEKHKEEEWFMEKYHPTLLKEKNKEKMLSRKRRRDTFMELLKNDWLVDVKVEYHESSKLEKFLDAVAVKLEGGTDHDLQLLSELYATRLNTHVDMKISEDAEKIKNQPLQKQLERSSDDSTDNPNDSLIHPNNDHDNHASKPKEEDEGIDCDDKQTKIGEDTQQIKVKIEEDETFNNEEEGEIVKNDEEGEIVKNEEEGEIVKNVEEGEDDDDEHQMRSTDEPLGTQDLAPRSQNSEEPSKVFSLHKTSSLFLRTVAPEVTRKEIEDIASQYPGFLRVAMSEPLPDKQFFRRAWVTFRYISEYHKLKLLCWEFSSNKNAEVTGAMVNRDLSKRIRLVPGIFQHSLVVKSDIKNAVSLIIHLDKQRRIWENEIADTSADINVKVEPVDMPDNMQTEDRVALEQLEQNESASSKEVKEENSSDDISKEKQNNDFERVQDHPRTQDQVKNRTTESSAAYEEGEVSNSDIDCKNPLLEDIKEFIIEESSTEESELIRSGYNAEDEDSTEIERQNFLRDENSEKVLDKLLLYLRVVHSIDYYNATDYPGEDEMPHRLGLLHARSLYPAKAEVPSLHEIKTTIKNHQSRIKPLFDVPTTSEIEQKQLGRIDTEVAVEEYIKANIKEIGQDKYQCLLSNKKFKGPEFARKHIVNKLPHMLEEKRLDVEYFNNYLADPKRLSML